LTDTQVDIDRGSLESTVSPYDTGVGRFEIRTPATVTGGRGTPLRVHDDAQGSRHEVLHGNAAIESPSQGEQRLAPDRGAAYDARGTLLGSHPLLPAPHLPTLDPGSGRLEFEPVPGASTYAVRVALDADGTRLESSRRVNGPGVFLQARGSGPRYTFVRGIHALGIEGHDAVLAVDTLRIGLRASDGTPVPGSDGTPVALDCRAMMLTDTRHSTGMRRRLMLEWLALVAVLTLLSTALAFWQNLPGIRDVNRRAYDLSMQAVHSPPASRNIVIITIDDASIDAL